MNENLTDEIKKKRMLMSSHLVPACRKEDNEWIPESSVVILASIIQYGKGKYPQNFFITKNEIAMDIYHTGNPSRRQMKNIDEGLQELYDYDPRFLKPVNGTRTRWEVNGEFTLSIQKDDYHYARFYSYEMDLIADHGPTNIIQFKAFYIRFLSLYFDNVFQKEKNEQKMRGCGYSINTLTKRFDVVKQTIENRIKTMKDLGLINIIPARRYAGNDGFKSISATYYRPGEREWADNYVEYRLNSPYFDTKRQYDNLQSAQSD